MTTLTIFVSSPGDVQNERAIVGRVVEKLQAQYWSFVRLELVLWEKKALRATAHFNEELVMPSSCDIVLGILWHRLGTPLPSQFDTKDGRSFDSGTEWEIVEAVEGYESSLAALGPDHAKPDIVVYRRRDLRLPEEDPEREEKAAEQEKKVAHFFKSFFTLPDGKNKRAFSPYRGLKEFEENLTLHLKDLIIRKIPKLTNNKETPPPINGNPYLGLSSFDFHHSDRFFGRNKAIREVLEQIKTQDLAGHPFVLIYGASGYGKSSLMRAGVAPRLTASGFLADHRNPVSHWRRITLTPSQSQGSPLETLAHSLLHPAKAPEETPENAPLIGLPELAEKVPGTHNSENESYHTASLTRLLSNPDTIPFVSADLIDCLDALSPAAEKTALLLQIDQFEELFTNPHLTQEQITAFFTSLSALSRTRRVWILATMRSEYFPRLSEFPELLPLVQKEGGYILEAPSDKELLEIIRYPALAGSMIFETHPEDGNRDLSDDIYEAALKQPDALPLLEFTLDELYKKQDIQAGDRTFNYDEYAEIGGLEHAISKRAQDTFDGLEKHQQNAHDFLFHKLISVQATGKGIATKVKAPLDDLKAVHAGAPAFIDAFLRKNLLVTDHDLQSGQTTITLAHEALIKNWALFANWIDDHKTLLQAETRLKESTQQYLVAKENQGTNEKKYLLTEANLAEALSIKSSQLFTLDPVSLSFVKASEDQSKRKTRLLTICSFVFGLVALIAIWGFYSAQKSAKEERKAKVQANHEKTKAELSLADSMISVASSLAEKEDYDISSKYLSNANQIYQKHQRSNLPVLINALELRKKAPPKLFEKDFYEYHITNLAFRTEEEIICTTKDGLILRLHAGDLDYLEEAEPLIVINNSSIDFLETELNSPFVVIANSKLGLYVIDVHKEEIICEVTLEELIPKGTSRENCSIVSISRNKDVTAILVVDKSTDPDGGRVDLDNIKRRKSHISYLYHKREENSFEIDRADIDDNIYSISISDQGEVYGMAEGAFFFSYDDSIESKFLGGQLFTDGYTLGWWEISQCHLNGNGLFSVYNDKGFFEIWSLKEQIQGEKIIPDSFATASLFKDDIIYIGEQNGTLSMYTRNHSHIDGQNLLIRKFPHSSAITDIAVNFNGLVATSTSDGKIHLWPTSDKFEPYRMIKNTNAFHGTLIDAFEEDCLISYGIMSDKITSESPYFDTRGVVFDSDILKCVKGSESYFSLLNNGQIWKVSSDLKTKTLIETIEEYNYTGMKGWALNVSPDETKILGRTCEANWLITYGQKSRVLGYPKKEHIILDAAFLDDQTVYMTKNALHIFNGEFQVWSIEAEEHALFTELLVTNKHFIIATSSGETKIYDSSSYELISTLSGKGQISDLTLSEDQRLLIVTYAMSSMEIWSLENFLLVSSFRGAGLPQFVNSIRIGDSLFTTIMGDQYRYGDYDILQIDFSAVVKSFSHQNNEFSLDTPKEYISYLTSQNQTRLAAQIMEERGIEVTDLPFEVAFQYLNAKGEIGKLLPLLDSHWEKNQSVAQFRNNIKTSVRLAKELLDNRDHDAFAFLLKTGFDIDTPDYTNSSYTLLHHFIEAKDVETVKLLLSNGADIHIENGDAEDAIEFAKRFLDLDLKELSEKLIEE